MLSTTDDNEVWEGHARDLMEQEVSLLSVR
jgi:hypothetical protein